MKIEYELIRTKRASVAVCVEPDGRIVVRAPKTAGINAIETFIKSKEEWIENARQRQKTVEAQKEKIVLTKDEISKVKKVALADLTERGRRYAQLMGVSYRSLRVNSAKTRWGSCSSGGSINFTYRLFFAPEELRDYVVVHELAHRMEMNHSAKFWAQVERILPDYKRRRKLLREFQRRVAIIEGDINENRQGIF